MQTNEQRKMILIMDDEDMVGEIACQMLEYLGFASTWVTNGADAVKEYRKQKEAGQGYAAVIMDLTVPGGMGGKEAITEILAIDREAKVFVSSGYSSDPVMVNYQDYGFAGVIAKPFDLAAMQRILTALN
ncbi:MAG: histidine kinase [uncultured bacterium]|nr:MAG: histidine kinase [uncultured bacterium]